MKHAYINGIILDGSKEMEPQQDKVILTDGENIEAIVEKAQIEDKDLTEYEITDLAGNYIMPGLINLHLHLPATGKPKKKQQDPVKLVKLLTSNALLRKLALNLCASSAKTQLLSGVTTIRTVGGVLDFDSKIRDQIKAGKLIGPRILSCDMAVSVEGGHMAHSLAYVANSAEEAAAYVRKIAENKPDWIKLNFTFSFLQTSSNIFEHTSDTSVTGNSSQYEILNSMEYLSAVNFTSSMILSCSLFISS